MTTLSGKVLERLREKYVLDEDDYDVFYILDCLDCGEECQASCLMRPEEAANINCYNCGGKLAHRRKDGATEATEDWDDIYA